MPLFSHFISSCLKLTNIDLPGNLLPTFIKNAMLLCEMLSIYNLALHNTQRNAGISACQYHIQFHNDNFFFPFKL